jgi:hypothetical protein
MPYDVDDYDRVRKLPKGWKRSDRTGNCYRRTDQFMVTVFRFNQGEHEGMFGICTAKFGHDEPEFDDEKFDDEYSALERAKDIIWSLENDLL